MGVGVEQFGVEVGTHPSSSTWKEYESSYFVVIHYKIERKG